MTTTLTMTTGVLAVLVVLASARWLDAGAARTITAGGATTKPSRAALVMRPRARHRQRVLDDTYPDALDLFVVSVQAGQLPLEALARIRPHVHPMIADAIGEVELRLHQGQRSVDALDALVHALGTRALALVATLAQAERTGLAVAPMIDRIADDARLHRRRRAEVAARELPVRLAFPLVLCTLPSFVLVAIAPLLVGALSSLRGT